MDQILTDDELLLNEQLRQEDLREEMERTKWQRYWRQIKKDWPVYVMLIPVILFFFLFRYLPINSIFLAFHRYQDQKISIFNNDFWGFYGFHKILFGDYAPQFWQAFRNTFTISMYSLLFGFPIPIILALFFSEIKNLPFRNVTQILSYLPNFISTVVITSLITLMMYGGTADGTTVGQGVLSKLLTTLGVVPYANRNILDFPQYFRSIYVVSGIWEGSGYGSIVYFAAIMAISPTNYEAARIDGASKLSQIRHVTLPGIASTLTIMLILRIGGVLNVGYEKVLLLYKNDTYTTADVISTYVLRLGGISDSATGGVSMIDKGYAATADLFNSVIAMFLVLGSNFISRRVSSTSLF